MNITIIQPSTHGRVTVRPLGLGYLASYLESKGRKVTIIDNDLEKLNEKSLKKIVLNSSPDVIGITCNLLNRKKAIRIANLFLDFPYIVFGGPQPTLEPTYFCIKDNYYVITGEGEISFENFLRCVEKNENFNMVKGLVYRNCNELITNEKEDLIQDIDVLPFPSVRHFKFEQYSDAIAGYKSTSLITSRGCPFKCKFCYHKLNGKYRQRGVANIIREIDWLKNDFDYKGFTFWDDNMTLRKEFVHEFTDTLFKKHRDIVWTCLSTVKTVDKELLGKMVKSGCQMVHFGIESGCQKSLDLMGKNVTVEQNETVIKWCKEVGLKCKACIMIGFPWETKEDIRLTAEFLERTKPDEAQIMLTTPMPDTELEKIILDMGYNLESIDKLENQRDFIVPFYETENFTKKELIMLYHEVYERYFLARGKKGKRLLPKFSKWGWVKYFIRKAIRWFSFENMKSLTFKQNI